MGGGFGGRGAKYSLQSARRWVFLAQRIFFFVSLSPYVVQMSLKHSACHTFRASEKIRRGSVLGFISGSFLEAFLLLFRVRFGTRFGMPFKLFFGNFWGSFWILLGALFAPIGSYWLLLGPVVTGQTGFHLESDSIYQSVKSMASQKTCILKKLISLLIKRAFAYGVLLVVRTTP